LPNKEQHTSFLIDSTSVVYQSSN